MTVNEQLRAAIGESGETHYRIGKGAGIAPSVLDRFVSRETDCLTGRNIDRLCDYFGLELRPKAGQAERKPPATKRGAKKK